MATLGLADTNDAALETTLDNGDIIEGIRFDLEGRRLGGPGRRRRHNGSQSRVDNKEDKRRMDPITRAMDRFPCLGVRVNLGPPKGANNLNCTNLVPNRKPVKRST